MRRLLPLVVLIGLACTRERTTSAETGPVATVHDAADAADSSVDTADSPVDAEPESGAPDAASDAPDPERALGTLLEIFVAKGKTATSPSIRTSLWCGSGLFANKHFDRNHLLANLPAISADGNTLLGERQVADSGIPHRGHSLVTMDRKGTVLRELPLWSVMETYTVPDLTPKECAAIRGVLRKRFDALEALFTSTEWRPLEPLPKTFRVLPKYSTLVPIPLPDGGSFLGPDSTSVLERFEVREPGGATVVDLAPEPFVAKVAPKGACVHLRGAPGVWFDATARLVLVRFESMCGSDTVPDAPWTYLPAFY